MPISASHLVQVLPRILKATGKDLVFNGLVLTNNATIKSGTAVAFVSASDVLDYFGSQSDEYKFASTYFGGFDNSQVKPATLYFYRRQDTALAGWCRGVSVNPITALTALQAPVLQPARQVPLRLLPAPLLKSWASWTVQLFQTVKMPVTLLPC